MFPLILLLGGLGGIGVLVNNWDEIVTYFRGKKIAVLGERGVGKTHLLDFLATGSIPTDTKQTVGTEKVPPRRFKLEELKLTLKETVDISGAKVAYGEWKSLHDAADIVFYLIRADRLLAGDKATIERIEGDCKHIASWRTTDGKKAPRLIIVGTHCDKDPAWKEITAETRGDYYDQVRDVDVIKRSVGRLGGESKVGVVFGSMETQASTELLVYELFKLAAS